MTESTASAPQPGLLETLLALLASEGSAMSQAMLLAGLPSIESDLSPELALRATRRLGFDSTLRSVDPRKSAEISKIERHHFPLIAFVEDRAEIVRSQEDLANSVSGHTQPVGLFILGERPGQSRETLIGQSNRTPRWLSQLIRLNRTLYAEVIAGSLFVNLFALAMPLFVMNVYDRVVPNQAIDTLWVLGIGLTLVLLFDLLIKSLRGYFIDIAGRRADLMLSAMTFEQVMSMQLSARPTKVGSFANQLLDFEQFRDFFTSTTLTALIDLPFVVLYLLIIYTIGGSIVVIPIIAIALICLVGVVAQRKLAPQVTDLMQASARKSGLLIETLSALELIKSSAAESQMQNRWERQQADLAELSLSTRLQSLIALNLVQWLQGMTTLLIVAAGVFSIREGTLTMGGLIACTILTGRSMQPMTQLASLLTRFQQAMAAFQSVQSLMQLPQERDLEQPPVHRPKLQAAIRLREVNFTYPNHPFPTLSAIELNIQPGERVGIIGPTGSGKSTLAKLVCKFYSPDQGSVLVGGTDLRQVDPGDLRRQISFLAQDAPLISGSVRDNIRFGQATLSDEAIVNAAEVSGIATYLNEHPEGFDLQVGEQGRQLSGGQKQAIALARALSNGANLVILDEPSNALDGQAEQSLIQSLSTYLSDRTLMLITHRTSMLALVDRLVVMRSGRIVLDGPKAEILQQLSKQPQAVR